MFDVAMADVHVSVNVDTVGVGTATFRATTVEI